MIAIVLVVCLCLAALALALVVRDVFVRALAVQVRRAELAVEVAHEAEVSELAKRVASLEGLTEHQGRELQSALSAISMGKVARR